MGSTYQFVIAILLATVPLRRNTVQAFVPASSSRVVDYRAASAIAAYQRRSQERSCKSSRGLPPSHHGFTTAQSLVTFAGVLINLLILTHMNQQLIKAYGGDASLVLGPFGAFLTLAFSVTGSPVAQPRNAILGQILSVSLAILLRQAPLPWTPEVRVSLTTATAIGLMARLGITHPPAGGPV